MCFVQVLCFYLIYISIISYCDTKTSSCPYVADKEPQLFILVNKTSSDRNISACILYNTLNTTIPFKQQDRMRLKCDRVAGTKLWNATVQVQWKLEQFNQKLMITDGITIGRNVLGSHTTTFNLDRYDDGLTVICASNGSEKYNTISVHFVYNKEENVADINEDIQNLTEQEGEIVRNDFANSVILYNAPDNNSGAKVIVPNDNIFESIKLEDNGTKYGVWAVIDTDLKNNKTMMMKSKFVVYVEPASSKTLDFKNTWLFLSGIGGISCIVFAIIIVVCCKYCKKKNENNTENPYAEVYEFLGRVQPNQYQDNNPNRAPEEENNAQNPLQNDHVVYAQIDIKRVDKSTPIQDSEPYAKIIGVIRPTKKGQNVKIFKGSM